MPAAATGQTGSNGRATIIDQLLEPSNRRHVVEESTVEEVEGSRRNPCVEDLHELYAPGRSRQRSPLQDSSLLEQPGCSECRRMSTGRLQAALILSPMFWKVNMKSSPPSSRYFELGGGA